MKFCLKILKLFYLCKIINNKSPPPPPKTITVREMIKSGLGHSWGRIEAGLRQNRAARARYMIGMII